KARGIKWVASIAKQAQVPDGAQILPNENGSASGLYLKAKINPKIQSPHIFLLPGPPRELQPIFFESVMSILRSIVKEPPRFERSEERHTRDRSQINRATRRGQRAGRARDG